MVEAPEQSGESVDVVLPVLRQHLRHADPVQGPPPHTRQVLHNQQPVSWWSLAASCRGHPVEAPGWWGRCWAQQTCNCHLAPLNMILLQSSWFKKERDKTCKKNEWNCLPVFIRLCATYGEVVNLVGIPFTQGVPELFCLSFSKVSEDAVTAGAHSRTGQLSLGHCSGEVEVQEVQPEQ